MVTDKRERRCSVFFKRRIPYDTIYKALTVTLSGLLLVMTVTMLLTITEPGKEFFLMILFEATSAFATVGLSMGLTPELSPFGKSSDYINDVCGKGRSIDHCFCCYTSKKARSVQASKRKKIMIG
ncbi:hypothetical protein GCM10020331_004530 [Ectobacillus funiculus]